jgi:cytochrome c553
MNSQVLVNLHLISVTAFLLIYLVKTILLFTNENALDRFTRGTRVAEMIISVLFLGTGIWLYAILGAIKVLQIVKLVCVFAAIPLAVAGFKKKKKPLAVVSLLLIIAAYGIADMSKKKPYIPTKVEITGNTDEASQLGIKTYAANCAMCHGMDGKKEYRNAANLSLSTLDEASIHLLVQEGGKDQRGTMPGFANTLSREEITAVSAFVFTLRK